LHPWLAPCAALFHVVDHPDDGKPRRFRIAAEAHLTIRNEAAKALGKEFADNLRILYGGSVKPDNAHSLMSESEIDGALVGGASLDPNSFEKIVKY
jgi:triosephosphate isomerase